MFFFFLKKKKKKRQIKNSYMFVVGMEHGDLLKTKANKNS
jgi:hypothetical protein